MTRGGICCVACRVKVAGAGGDEAERDKCEWLDRTGRFIHKGNVDPNTRKMIRPNVIGFLQGSGGDTELPSPWLADPRVEIIPVLRSNVGASPIRMSLEVARRCKNVLVVIGADIAKPAHLVVEVRGRAEELSKQPINGTVVVRGEQHDRSLRDHWGPGADGGDKRAGFPRAGGTLRPSHPMFVGGGNRGGLGWVQEGLS